MHQTNGPSPLAEHDYSPDPTLTIADGGTPTSTTEQPTLPEWETRSRNHQRLPRLERTYVGDPAYMRARLQEALQRAHTVAEGADDMAPATRTDFELRLLRGEIERLADEIRYYTPAADEFLTVLQTLAPGIDWVHHCMGFGGFGDLETCIASARALRMIEEDVGARTAERIWHGVPEGWDVNIYLEGAR